MRRAARTDRNQKLIVEAFRSQGLSVAVTSGAGDGFPDLVVGWHNVSALVEVKDGDKPPSERKLTPKQEDFHNSWNATIYIVENIEQAISLSEKIKRQSNLVAVKEK